MKYLDYRGMKEYYTIDEVCRQFEISKQELRHYAEKIRHPAAGGPVRQLGFPQGSGAQTAQFHLQGAV